MDALFPSAEDMAAFNEIFAAFTGYGLGIAGCVSVLGYLISFIVGIFKEV